MGVYTFVCRSSGEEWTAKQLKGELEAFAATPYELQRRLASAADSAAGVQSSFAMVSPSSAVFQVIIGAVGGGAAIGGAAAGGAAAGGAASEAPKSEEKKEEEKEESEDDLGFSLFD
uniref:60S acidic ribosomal protein P3 n=1 Tax=Oryza barthii TaxID=65489 RepID=A0A0D3ELE4_9ORYZ